MGIIGYIGTYTEAAYNGRGRGIYVFSLDRSRGTLENIHLCAESVNPTYIAVNSPGRVLYAVNEIDDWNAGNSGAVSAFKIEGERTSGEQTSGLRLRNCVQFLKLVNQVSSGGKGPCHIVLDKTGTRAVVSNYTGGCIAVLPVQPDGSLREPSGIIPFTGSGPNRERQEAPHAHSFLFDRDGRRGFAFDLGTDRVMAYNVSQTGNDPAGFLVPPAEPWFSARPGAGPRHGAIHPAGKTAYFLNELDSTIDVLAYDTDRGGFTLLQTLSTLPPDTSGANTGAAIRVRADGKYVYASNRGNDSIAIFKVESACALGGTLKDREVLSFVDAVPSGGRTPRDFTLDPEGRFLVVCHQDSDNVTVFRVDEAAGMLKQTGDYKVPSPVCVLFGP
jgi:6-phosphogluconolactonase